MQLSACEAFSLRHQEQVCLRKRTQRHGVISTLQRCMKHAHIITQRSTHAICLLLFTTRWRARPGTACWLALAEEQQRKFHFLLILVMNLPGWLRLFPKLNYHFPRFVATTLCCVRHAPSACSHVRLFWLLGIYLETEESSCQVLCSVAIDLMDSCAISEDRSSISACQAEQMHHMI